MATYVPILDTQLDPDAPLTSTLMYQLRDNTLAIAEGATGAARILLPGIERLSPGTQIRSRIDTSVVGSAGVVTAGYSFSFAQHGSVRLVWDVRRISAAGSNVNITVFRSRSGVSTSVAVVPSTTTAWVTETLDVSIIPGDSVQLSINGVSNNGAELRNWRIQTNGEDLWPGVSAILEGNRAAP